MQWLNSRMLLILGASKNTARKIAALWATYPRSALAIKFLAVYAIFLIAAWFKHYDPDFGWHLKAGEFIRNNGVPVKDIFSYTASDFNWINHEWLSDAFLSVLYDKVGYQGLSILYATMWTASFFIVKAYKNFLFLTIATLAVAPYSGVRATTWTFLFTAVLLALITAKQKKLRWLIPGLFLLWANIHGGFFIGLAVVGFYFVKSRDTQWLVIFAVSALLTLLNPYGIYLHEEIILTMSDTSLHWQIAEWFPASFLIYTMPFIFSTIWAAGFVLTLGKDWRKKAFKLSPIFYLASLTASRHFPLFVLVSTAEIDGYLTEIKKKIPKKLNRVARAMVVTPPVIVISVTVWHLLFLTPLFSTYVDAKEEPYPTLAVTHLQANPCQGNIFNSYNYGGYLIWKLPDAKVYIDGRMPSWRDPNGQKYFDRYHALENDENATTSQEFKDYNIKCVIWPNITEDSSKLVKSLKQSGWQQVDAASNKTYILWLSPD
jgi:hypothetical protein